MDNSDFLAGLLITLGLIALVFIVGFLIMFPIMLLWNWLMPTLFHLPTITIWQAWGLSVLCSFLFKSNITTKK
jgi:hypothetical protein